MNTIKLIETELMKVLDREKDSGLGHRSASGRIASPTRAVREIGCSNVLVKGTPDSPVLTGVGRTDLCLLQFLYIRGRELWTLDGNSRSCR